MQDILIKPMFVFACTYQFQMHKQEKRTTKTVQQMSNVIFMACWSELVMKMRKRDEGQKENCATSGSPQPRHGIFRPGKLLHMVPYIPHREGKTTNEFS